MSETRSTLAHLGAAALATTAGLAVATAAQAGTVVYTDPEPNPVSSPATPINLDLNGDTVLDFVVAHGPALGAGQAIDLIPVVTGNAYVGEIKPSPIPGFEFFFVSALPANTQLPGSQLFEETTGTFRTQDALLAGDPAFGSGPWFGQNAFAGLQFMIGTNTHFGWAQLKIEGTNGTLDETTFPPVIVGAEFKATLFDFAFCDEPNGSILTGQTSGPCGSSVPPPSSVPEPGSLMLLAAGAVAVGALRRQRRASRAR